MKKFKFSLEKVLGYRSQLERERRRALSKAIEVLRRRQGQWQELATKIMNYRNRLAQMGTGKISTRQLAIYRSYMTHLESELMKASEWLRDASSAVESHRTDLIRASREKKVLEKVKEGQKRRYDYEAGREETGVLDEVGATGFMTARARAEEAR